MFSMMPSPLREIPIGYFYPQRIKNLCRTFSFNCYLCSIAASPLLLFRMNPCNCSFCRFCICLGGAAFTKPLFRSTREFLFYILFLFLSFWSFAKYFVLTISIFSETLALCQRVRRITTRRHLYCFFLTS